MDTPSSFDRVNRWIRDSVTVKMVVMGILTLLLFIPSLFIRELIRERGETQELAAQEVQQSWGNAQQITGPLLIVPFREVLRSGDEPVTIVTRHAYFLPNSLDVEGTVIPEIRYRGIYEVVVYRTELSYSGHFAGVDFSDWDVDSVLWDEATVAVGITDMRGIEDSVTLHWDETSFAFDAGVEPQGVIESGIGTRVPDADKPHSFRFDVSLRGSHSLDFIPVGRETTVSLTSDWSSPSFGGAFLPDQRTVTDDGFSAEWQVLHLNRPYPQQWADSTTGIEDSAFGVTLLVGVDHYQKSMRAAKYALLVIALTFLAFFLVEIRYGKRAHPFQYILIGMALCLFYTLLLSLSEFMAFNAAYAIGGAVTTLTIVAYVKSVFSSRHLSTIAGGVLVILYAFVFLVLQLEDYALLVGSVGLFVVLALTMYLSRNVDWFSERE